MKFNEKLAHAIKLNNSHVCLGLDTDIEKLPLHLSRDLNGVLNFNKEIIETTQDHVAAYKFNIAFYERHGSEGFEVLKESLNYIGKNIVTIADAKRADIGNTSLYYAKTFFDYFNFDSITVSPYMGYDSLKPFLDYTDKGIIILVLTSNSGSKDFQELSLANGHYLFEEVAQKIQSWDDHRNICAVVGATNNENIKRVRSILKDQYFLVPGIGAQGGSLDDVLNYSGKNVLINSSRGLIYASNKSDFANKCLINTINLKNEINTYFSK